MAAGRPRSFCKNEALDQALQIFWRKGFEGASICDLTDAMGINPPSLYAAFGNKEQLFRQALDRYTEVQAAHRAEALSAPTGREAIAALLHGAAAALTDKESPAGCLFVQGIAGSGEHAACIREMLNAKAAASENDIRVRLEQSKAAGEVPDDFDAEDMTRYISTVVKGMAIQAANGAGRTELDRVVDHALRAWPG